MSEIDTTKEVFKATWPGGYVENFWNYPSGSEEDVAKILKRHGDQNSRCLELGCGGGFWTTKYLRLLFKEVICLDLIEKPNALNLDGITYIEVGDRDFSCRPVPDGSVDFAFSFGLFCHLSNSACRDYLHGLFRVMRPGAHAVIMFANYRRYPATAGDPSQKRFSDERVGPGTCWFYNDEEIAKSLVEEVGFVDFQDALPTFRDTLAVFKKPCAG